MRIFDYYGESGGEGGGGNVDDRLLNDNGNLGCLELTCLGIDHQKTGIDPLYCMIDRNAVTLVTSKNVIILIPTDTLPYVLVFTSTTLSRWSGRKSWRKQRR